jgi:hypothetical protein
MATHAGAVAAIEARLTANWTTTPIAFENAASDPVVLDGNSVPIPWVFCEVETDAAGIRGVGTPGSHTVLETGVVRVTVFVPVGTERATAQQYADSIGEIFRVKQFYDTDPGACVRTWTPTVSLGRPAETQNPAGSWWAVSVAIPYEFYNRA